LKSSTTVAICQSIGRCLSAWRRQGGDSAAVYLLQLFWEGLRMDNVTEDNCTVCSAWPKAERAERRREQFDSDDYVRMSTKGVCAFCWMEFFQSIMVITDSPEEMDALREAIRESRRKGNPMPNGHELLKEIRARKAAEH
jgi:hypothetical protein